MSNAAGGSVCEGRERAPAADPGLLEPQPAPAKADSDRGNVKKRNRRRRAGGQQPISKSMIGAPVSLLHVNRLQWQGGGRPPTDPRLTPEVEFNQPQTYEGRGLREGSTEGHSGPEATRRHSRQVRRGIIGPPTNFQHVAHVGLDPCSVLPQTTEDRRRPGSPSSPTRWDEEQLCDGQTLDLMPSTSAGGRHRSHWKSHRWSSPIGALDLQEAQVGSHRWPSLDGDSGQQLIREASVNLRQKNNVKTRESSSNLKRRGSLEERKQQQRGGHRVTRTSSRPVDLPPPGEVRVIGGQCRQQQQHSAPGGLIIDTIWRVGEHRDQHHPATLTDEDKKYELDSKSGNVMYDSPEDDSSQQVNQRWPGPGGAGNQETQWNNQRWPGPGSQVEAHRWTIMNDPSRPVSPPPRGLRKDSIGPPTNFQHILHVDRDSTDHELQQLMANLNKQGTPPLTTHKSLPDLVEGRKNPGSRSHRGPAGRLSSPPPAIRKHLIGPPTNFQHVSHVGFGCKRTIEATEEQQDPSRAISWDECHLSDPETRNCISDDVDEDGGLQTQPWSNLDGGCGQKEVQCEDQHWSSTAGVDSRQQNHHWSILPLQDSSLRKDMIGPPTNFQHILHLDRDSLAQDVHKLLREHAGVDQQTLAEPETRRIVTFTEGVEEASGRCTSQPARVRKDMIGPPTNFQHVTHVGFSSNTTPSGSEEDHRPT